MPAKAVKPELPPVELRDRTEGWGQFGHIFNYPAYRDDREWTYMRDGSAIVIIRPEFNPEPSETSHGEWFRNGELI